MNGICFFSYSWKSNTDKLTDILDVMYSQIMKKSKIQVIYDKRSFKIGDSYKEKENQILNSDTVVIFFTPEFKKTIESHDESREVYYEYKKILEGVKKKRLKVIPVLAEGTVESSVTKEFNENIVADFSEGAIYIREPGRRRKLNPKHKEKISNLVDIVVDETLTWNRRKPAVYINKEDSFNALFRYSDSSRRLPPQCMYPSNAYEDMICGHGGILVGRKGTGKTTYFDILENLDNERFDKKYKALRPISVQDIEELPIYIELKKISQDKGILNQNRIIDLFWEIYIYLSAIYIVCVEEENCRIHDRRKEIFASAGKKIKQAFKIDNLDTDNAKRAIFTESYDLWCDYLERGMVDFATEEAFLAAIVANFSAENVISKFLSRNLFKKICKAIDQCERKIIIALDRFDTMSEDFRLDTKRKLESEYKDEKDEGIAQREFDRLFYRELITMVEKLGKADTGIMSNVVFSVILPQDRIDQIRAVDRDFIKHSFTRLSWDAVELLWIILLRIGYMYQEEVNTNAPVKEEFERIMKRCIPEIPLKLMVNEHEIGLYQYILRASFWRPREIIKYFAKLIDASRRNKMRKEVLSDDTIKDMLYEITEEIVESEFYKEYNGVFFNIKDIMSNFEEKSIVMEPPEFIDLVNDFEFQGSLLETQNLEDKVRSLYQLGIIGLYFPKNQLRKRNLRCAYNFAFNEGFDPLEKNMKKFFTNEKVMKIIINPIFAKKLNMVYPSTGLICDYDWDYLWNNHISYSGRKGI